MVPSRRAWPGLWAALLLAGAVGCGATAGGPAGTVLLALRFGDDVPQGRRDAVTSVVLDVTGAETFQVTEPITAQFAAGSATLRYHPRVGAGDLSFTVVARDAARAAVAAGSVRATIDASRQVDVALVLEAGGPRDGGVDLGPAFDAMPDLSHPDLGPRPDLPDQQVVPSHTSLPFLGGAGDLVAAVATIDTTHLQLRDDQGVAVDLPVGADLTFDAASRSAVLRVGAWTVGAGHDLKVEGGRPLIVLARGPVTIAARVRASATASLPGPGGHPPDSGPGPGAAGQIMTSERPGGGGAGYHDVGASGGGTASQAGPAGGASYGSQASDWDPGSGGGDGAAIFGQSAPYACRGGGFGSGGGGGGGGVQVTSAVSIAVTASGTLEAGGGGGQAGCLYMAVNGLRAMGGGGGGSGGAIFLEAPQVTIDGGLFANGGGGGGAADLQNQRSGQPAEDGPPSAKAARGGGSSGDGGDGGDGGNTNLATASPTPAANLNAGGGGGGSAGRIFLRTRAPAAGAGPVSPSATVLLDL